MKDAVDNNDNVISVPDNTIVRTKNGKHYLLTPAEQAEYDQRIADYEAQAPINAKAEALQCLKDNYDQAILMLAGNPSDVTRISWSLKESAVRAYRVGIHTNEDVALIKQVEKEENLDDFDKAVELIESKAAGYKLLFRAANELSCTATKKINNANTVVEITTACEGALEDMNAAIAMYVGSNGG